MTKHNSWLDWALTTCEVHHVYLTGAEMHRVGGREERGGPRRKEGRERAPGGGFRPDDQ